MLIYFAWSNLSNVEARKDREMIYFYPVCMIRFLLFRCMFYINWGKNMSMHVNTLGYFITFFMSVQTIINAIALYIEISLVFLFVSWTLFPQFVNLIYFQDQKLFFLSKKNRTTTAFVNFRMMHVFLVGIIYFNMWREWTS